MTATVSSIHINGWFGDHGKWSGAQWMVQRLFGRRLDDEVARWVYVGDSTNDQVMFRQLPHSVGVANLLRFAAELTHWPAWITAASAARASPRWRRRCWLRARPDRLAGQTACARQRSAGVQPQEQRAA
jgi:hypothetical protein